VMSVNSCWETCCFARMNLIKQCPSFRSCCRRNLVIISRCFVIIIIIFWPSVLNSGGYKILKSKQVRPTAAFTRWWKCRGRRPHYPIEKPLTSAGTGKLPPWCLQWRLSFICPASALIPLLGGSRSRMTLWLLVQRCGCWPAAYI